MVTKCLSQIPNSLTIFRILLAFLFPFALERWRFALLVLALLTEFFDGALSRWFHWQSRLGQTLDPIADKLFFGSVAITLLIEERLMLREVVLLSIRDLVVILGASWLFLRHGSRALVSLKPGVFGKITTTLQYGCFFFLFFNLRLNPILLSLTAVMGSLGAGQYIFQFARRANASRGPHT